ncbi:hypothetical protein SPAB_04013 [Salmonella enterica subsp. enterica serovar Paratyphi B str. SPB7]|uniref:Uncharacterized protein n=1 Tax=Salmonella paratyphi B (strain ATCC BAA-1250 / SPB7) TaxID=1016998 RepID=A0A6C6Z7Q2_SALPB|nr:hypothetical protein SPAB_04013 [Salmonella enterica subsp. enterica serovar Paratyphi B str. SPB7]
MRTINKPKAINNFERILMLCKNIFSPWDCISSYRKIYRQ